MARYLFLLFTLLVKPAWADAAVWKVSKGDHHLYIGGTLHVLEASDYPLPSEFEQAYLAAEKIVLEVDIEMAGTLNFQASLLEQALYRDGTTLATHIRPSTLRKLRGFTRKRGIALDALLPFKVGMLVVMLTGHELQRHGISAMGVDQYFHTRALEDQKPVIALETIAQQIEFLTGLGEGKEDEMVRQTIEELDNFGEEFSAMKSAWRKGDTQKLADIVLQDFVAFPAAYASMLVNRNRAWLRPITAMLEDQTVEYVLVGMLHLVGDDSVLAMLNARGYRVEKL